MRRSARCAHRFAPNVDERVSGCLPLGPCAVEVAGTVMGVAEHHAGGGGLERGADVGPRLDRCCVHRRSPGRDRRRAVPLWPRRAQRTHRWPGCGTRRRSTPVGRRRGEPCRRHRRRRRSRLGRRAAGPAAGRRTVGVPWMGWRTDERSPPRSGPQPTRRHPGPIATTPVRDGATRRARQRRRTPLRPRPGRPCATGSCRAPPAASRTRGASTVAVPHMP